MKKAFWDGSGNGFWETISNRVPPWDERGVCPWTCECVLWTDPPWDGGEDPMGEKPGC